MLILVTGGEKSGKSAVAEDRACELEPGEKIYLATMLVRDEEGEARVARHRKMREGRGFVTVERPFDVAGAVDEFSDSGQRTVLLECAANLLANELFERGPCRRPIQKKLFGDILELAGRVRHLIVVSDEFARDSSYDEETLNYIGLLDELNALLAEAADERLVPSRSDETIPGELPAGHRAGGER